MNKRYTGGVDQVNELFEQNIDWARQLGRRVVRALPLQYEGNMWSDDVEEAALEGLWQAAQRWDGRGNFQGFASIRVTGAARDLHRELAKTRRKSVVPIASLAATSAHSTALIAQKYPWLGLDHWEPEFNYPNPDPDPKDQLLERLSRASQYLPDGERRYVDLSLQGYSYEEIAAMWPRVYGKRQGVNHSRICQIAKAAHNHLRELLDLPIVPTRQGDYGHRPGWTPAYKQGVVKRWDLLTKDQRQDFLDKEGLQYHNIASFRHDLKFGAKN